MIGTILSGVGRRLDRRRTRAPHHARQAEHRCDHDRRARRARLVHRAWLTYQLGYNNGNGGWQVIPFLVGIIVAIILIAIYIGITGRRGAKTPTVR